MMYMLAIWTFCLTLFPHHCVQVSECVLGKGHLSLNSVYLHIPNPYNPKLYSLGHTTSIALVPPQGTMEMTNELKHLKAKIIQLQEDVKRTDAENKKKIEMLEKEIHQLKNPPKRTHGFLNPLPPISSNINSKLSASETALDSFPTKPIYKVKDVMYPDITQSLPTTTIISPRSPQKSRSRSSSKENII